MAHDLQKWMAPATNGDAVRLVLECRIAMSHLQDAIIMSAQGNAAEAAAAINRYREHDGKLQALISEVGGFDAVED